MHLLDLIFPKLCVACGRVGKYICTECRKQIKTLSPADTICPVCQMGSMDGYTHVSCRGKGTPEGLTSFFRYEGPIRRAIKTIKYRMSFDVCKELISIVPPTSYNMIPTYDPHKCVLIPIPLHVTRIRDRGFNQAQILGSLVAAHLQVKIRPDVIIRAKHTDPQVAMPSRSERITNMDGVFAVAPNAKLGGIESVILFDDVYTTGATLLSATKVLRKEFGVKVWLLSLAR